MLEVVVAKYWADLGEVTLDYSVAFHGVKPESPSVTMQGADGILSLELRSGLRSEEISPAVTLKNSVQVLRYVSHIEMFSLVIIPHLDIGICLNKMCYFGSKLYNCLHRHANGIVVCGLLGNAII